MTNWIKTSGNSNIIYLKKFITKNNEKYTKNEFEKLLISSRQKPLKEVKFI